MAFVCKQLFWLSASIKLDNNNDVLKDLWPFFSLYALPHTLVGLTGCISIVFQFEHFHSFNHYAACWFPLSSFIIFLCITEPRTDW